MTQLSSGSIINTKATSTEYDSQFTVTPTVTTTYRVEAHNDPTKFKTCIIKVPNITQVVLKYSTTSIETIASISADTAITVNTGSYIYLGYEVVGDGTVALPVDYQNATWSDDSSTSKTKTIQLTSDGVTTFKVTSTHNNTIKSFTLTVTAVTPSAIVSSISIDKEDVTINSGESVTINSIVSGQYLTGGINVYYE